MQVNILRAKNRLSQLIKSVARLVPFHRAPQGAAERSSAHAILDWLGAHRLPPHARRSAQEIDQAIARERASWD